VATRRRCAVKYKEMGNQTVAHFLCAYHFEEEDGACGHDGATIDWFSTRW